MFGFDHSLFRVGRYPPSDFDVATEVARLVAAGHADQLILSAGRVRQDATAARTVAGAMPTSSSTSCLCCAQLGVEDGELDRMLVGNPRRLLTVS